MFIFVLEDCILKDIKGNMYTLSDRMEVGGVREVRPIDIRSFVHCQSCSLKFSSFSNPQVFPVLII